MKLYRKRVKQMWLWFLLFSGLMLGQIGLPPTYAQDLPTATPDAEGIIYAEVLPNDSLWAIAARSGISLAELLDLNNLTEDALIQPGELLIVGIVAATPTPEATPTAVATREPPTPAATVPPPPPTVICLVAFTDENGNGEREPTEPLQAGVAFTVFTAESVVANYVTDGVSEPFCLTDLAAGNYQVTRSVGRDETLTNSGNRTVILATGDQVMLGFGGFTGQIVTAMPVSTPTEASNPPTQPAVVIGDAPGSATPESPSSESPNENGAGRPFLIGAGILIGILLLGTAVFLSRKQN
ncbi:LysM peptidoglycan-binding domain-containing protein [Candidatus Leptofilum sp.]|uniref:LysM peptidoglycan-binding domain-containing protein n=1 Tax=Candidatus Leptofilum sp. TaxID=3241576 RepID=UPI003B5956A5